MSEPLWANGPGEILRHGLSLLEEDSDTKRRLAMIAIDNSVELMLKTYISLPLRVTGLNISRKDREEICSTFPKLLDGIECHASNKIVGIDLGEIEWFHRLRNELYHQGNGLTVERRKVEVYAELAKVLFENLFETKLQLQETKDMRNVGEFIGAWINVEKELAKIGNEKRQEPPTRIVHRLVEEGKITQDQYNEFRDIQRVRNEVVHGVVKPDGVLNKELINRTLSIGSIILTALGVVKDL